MRVVRLFVSSPADAEFERRRVDRVVERLNGELAGVARLESIRWEREFYTAHATFQDQIPQAADCDIVVAILRHRLGTELPDDFPHMPNGDRYPSGTAYEVLTALQARRKRDLPDVYVFRYPEPPTVRLDDDDTNALIKAQWEKLKRFFEAWFVTPEGHFKAAFQEFRSTDEFEAQIESLLRKWLEDKVLKGRSVVWPVATKGSPFRGLAAFGAKHAPVFFGRSSSIAKATDALKDAAKRGTPFLLILGASGAGKSSLVHAGLVPRFTTPGVTPDVDVWRVAAMRPSEHAEGPLAALAGRLFDDQADIGEEDRGRLAALPEIGDSDYSTPADFATLLSRADAISVKPILRALDRVGEAERARSGFDRPVRADLLLVVDQLDELFAGDVEEDQRNAFARVLSALAATGRVWIAATLRADLYERYLKQPELLGLKTRGAAVDLAYPAAAEMAEIVRGPATAADLTYETDPETGERLDDRLLRDVDQPDMLPLLEFTLNRLFEQRRAEGDETRLTVAAYDALGGLSGAIDKEAEGAVSALGGAERDRLPRLLRQLAAPAQRREATDQGVALTVRSISLDEAAYDTPSERLIQALIGARILLSSGGEDRATIRLAHQRVLESWQRARRIVATNADFYRIRQEVEDQHGRWQASGRQRDLLIPSGLPLAEAESIAGRFAEELPPQARDFIAASRRRSRRRQRLTAGAAVVFALIAVVALWQYRMAHEARLVAVEQQERAERSLDFALSTADSLALDVVRELAHNYTIPTSEKLFFADRIDQRFGALLGKLDESSGLRLRYADLLTSIAFMLLDTRWYGKAKERAERAHALLSSDIQPGSPASVIAARAKIALAFGEMLEGGYKRAARLLDQAQGLLVQTEAVEWVGGRDATTRAELVRARALLLLYEYKYTLALEVIHGSRVSLQRFIEEAKPDSDVAAALFSKILIMDRYASEIASALQRGDLEDRVELYRDHLTRAKPFFPNGRVLQWTYYQARGYLQEAKVRASTNRLDDALVAVDIAVRKLELLLARDYQNLAWRKAMVDALMVRAGIALQADNFFRARQDLDVARTFSVSLIRDSGVNIASLSRASGIDFQAGRFLLAKQDSEQALRQFAKIFGRANWIRNNGGDPRLVREMAYWGHYGLTQAYLAAEKNEEARASIVAGLELLQRVERISGPSARLANRRIYLYLGMLKALDEPNDEMAWQRAYDHAMAQVDYLIDTLPDSRDWLGTRTYLLGTKAARLVRNDADTKAAELYAQAAERQLAIAKRDPADLGLLAAYVYYQRERLELLSAAGAWGDAAAVAEAARLALAHAEPAEAPVRSTYLLSHWNAFVSVLEAAAKSAGFEGAAGDLGLDGGRARLQRELALAKDAASNIAVLKDQRRRAVSEHVKPFDLTRLQLGEFKTGEEDNIYTVKRRIGWASEPIYQGPWRTLVGRERDAAITRFRSLPGTTIDVQHIQRIRTLRLPFYDDGALFEAEYLSGSGSLYVLALLAAGGADYLLDGRSNPIHQANASAPIELADAAAVTAYLRFFTSYIAGESGSFLLVESAADIAWAPNTPIETRVAVSKLLRPVAVWPNPQKKNYWLASASVQYGTAISSALFAIEPTGMVTMLDYIRVARNLPIEPPQYTTRGRLRRAGKMLVVSAFGESPVVREVDALVDLSRLSDAERPAHYLDLAELAASLQQAIDRYAEPGS